MWQKIKDFFKKAKKWIIAGGLLALVIAIIVFFKRITGIFQNTTDKLRDAKEKSDKEKNQTYTATNTETRDKTETTSRNPSTQQVADDIIAQNKAYLEKLKNEQK